MPGDFTFRVDTVRVQQVLKGSPKIANGQLNRDFKSVGGKFSRLFASSRLNRRGIQIRRRGGRGRRGGVFLPSKMRAAGFSATLQPQPQLERKTLRIATRSPVMVAHERGATIRGRKGFLRIRVTTARARALVARRSDDPAAVRKRKLPFFILTRKAVRIPPRLQFISTWRGFLGQARQIIRQGFSRMVDRIAAQRGRRAR